MIFYILHRLRHLSRHSRYQNSLEHTLVLVSVRAHATTSDISTYEVLAKDLKIRVTIVTTRVVSVPSFFAARQGICLLPGNDVVPYDADFVAGHLCNVGCSGVGADIRCDVSGKEVRVVNTAACLANGGVYSLMGQFESELSATSAHTVPNTIQLIIISKASRRQEGPCSEPIRDA